MITRKALVACSRPPAKHVGSSLYCAARSRRASSGEGELKDVRVLDFQHGDEMASMRSHKMNSLMVFHLHIIL